MATGWLRATKEKHQSIVQNTTVIERRYLVIGEGNARRLEAIAQVQSP
jgi:hypothetical protein